MAVLNPTKKLVKRTSKNKLWDHFLAHVTEFCKTTTIHGFNHIVAPGRHWLEKLFWITIITAAASFAASIIYRSYSRYKEDPTVISIDKNYRSFEVDFPATTFCFEDKLNKTKAEEIIKKKWSVSDGDPEFEMYMDFLQTLSNSSYENLKDFEKFSNVATLETENLAKLMYEINFNLENDEHIRALENGSKEFYHETLTEMGICFSFNSLVTPYLRPGGKTNKGPTILKAFPRLLKCNFIEGNCYGKMINAARPLKFYVHSPLELPDSSRKYWTVGSASDVAVKFTYLSIEADPLLKRLRIKQRKCRFRDESNLPESPYYSTTLCRMNCRRRLTMELCKCVPHFYVKLANQPYCDLKGLTCIAKNSTYIAKLISDNDTYKYPCPCYPSCSNTDYIAINVEGTKWGKEASGKMKIQYKYEIEKFSKTILKRTIIYGIGDLLVSLGGTATLFLGCSLMSGVELIYFFTLRLTRYMIQKMAEKNKPKTPKKRLRKYTLNHSDLFIE